MRLLAPAFGVVALAFSACGGTKAMPASPVAVPTASAALPVVASRRSDHTLARSALRATIAQGLGGFLQRIELDDHPVMVGGRFRGFRIAALRDAPFWSGVDLKPGDVIMGVNGLPIERPEQAQRAFEALEVASELRVSYERDGEPRELVYPIVEDR